jgi:hypothetical protein
MVPKHMGMSLEVDLDIQVFPRRSPRTSELEPKRTANVNK